ncbi:hypothetical protein DB88DRAFT_487440 [Papiliotrema laurentii]|uniref:Uncharacterized protein n=1 Tax=Papiliotrema laurentii TaxID=5418 RepID=A0AAD9L738_PAPLA|nr:hypothetical protein DB88DRAFT_487440 [Papiliotrema laurentii]
MAGPSTEQLALSASLFTSAIDAWIPASFGPKPTAADQKAQFDQRLRQAALQGDNERLGAGHPDSGVYKPRGPSLSSLERKLGKVDRKGKAGSPLANPASAQLQRDDSDDDDEESRTRSVGRKKVNAVADLLRGKKSKKGKEPAGPLVHPLLNLSNGASASTNDTTPVQGTTTPLTGASSSPGGSGTFPFQGPLAVESPRAKQQTTERPSRKRPRESTDVDSLPGPILRLEPSAAGIQGAGQTPEAEDRDPAESDAQGEAKLSKTQRRRDARKRAKLARQE